MSSTIETIAQMTTDKSRNQAWRNRVLKGLGGVFGLKIVLSGSSFLLTILLARMLGARGFGAYSYTFALVVLLGVPAILGMDQLLVRNLAAYQVKSEWGLMRGLLRRANQSVLIASLALGLLAEVVSWVFKTHFEPQTLLTFSTALILLPLIALTRVRHAALQGLNYVVLGQVPEALVQPILFLALIGGAYFLYAHSLTPPVAMGLNVVVTVVGFALGALFLYTKIPRLVKEASPVYQDFSWMRSALSMLLITGLSVVFGQADTLILGAIKGSQVVGVYAVAAKAAALIGFFLTVQNAVFASTAAGLYASGEKERLQSLVTKFARFIFLASLPLGIGLIGFGHQFLLYFYGPQFMQAQKALAILSFGQLVNVGTGLNGILLIMTGHEGDGVTAVGASAASNILLNLLLVPGRGMEGAAIANASGLILLNVWATTALYRRTGLHSTVLGTLSFRRLF